ncbi:CHAT domain-containing protein [candidate division KSB1 bacterium]|nr:CHAT domain-containing protein [candidate division KSB1 bacterium]
MESTMRMRRILMAIYSLSLLVLLWSSGLCAIDIEPDTSAATTAYSQLDLLRNYTQITTHPGEDVAPAVSHDGKWIAFTSNRSGNRDIWVKSTAGGRSFQITSHKADDSNPAWGPDDDVLLFVSKREDAEGDIWQVELDVSKDNVRPDSKPVKLTTRLGYDDFPKFSPDGRKIAFVSSRSGHQEIWLLFLKTKNLKQLTRKGGTHPAWSSDGEWLAFTSFREGAEGNSDLFVLHTSGRAASTSGIESEDGAIPLTRGFQLDGFPCWSPEGYGIVFSRIGLDIDNDGLLTPNDQSSLWMLDATQLVRWQSNQLPASAQSASESLTHPGLPRAYPLTQWGQKHTLPAWDKESRIFFNAYTRSGWDVFRVSHNGPLPIAETGGAQLKWIHHTFPFPGPGLAFNKSIFILTNTTTDTSSENIKQILYLRLLALNQLLEFYPDANAARAWALYELARTYEALGYPSLATSYFERVLNEYPDQKHVGGFAEIARVESRIDEFGAFYSESRKIDFNADVSIYRKIINKYRDYPRACARAEIILADLLTAAGQQVQAFQIYQNFFQTYPQLKTEQAEIQLKIGLFFNHFSQFEAERQAYLTVLEKYPDQHSWVAVAIERLLSFHEDEADTLKLIQRYQEIVDNYADYPRLAATAQYRIGRTFLVRKAFENAFGELKRVEEKFPNQQEIVAQAQLLIAEIYLVWQDYFNAFETYEKVMRQTPDLQNGLYATRAKSRLVSELLDSAERLKSQEIRLALSRFMRARSIQPENIQAHRGVIACMYALKKIDEAIESYQITVQQSPENQVLLYSLGLCYSYKAVEKFELYPKKNKIDVKYIEMSNKVLEEVLSLDYRITQAYLTLSANYETLERYELSQADRPKSFFTKATNSILAPVTQIMRTVFRIQEKEPTRWYEKGIDLLTTAITINDETRDPQTETLLAHQLANLYYQLKEFGYASAYQFYRYRISLDSTFMSREQEASIYTRLGHCALYVEDFANGPFYLKRAVQLYQGLANGKAAQANQELKARYENYISINTTRLALLYQLDKQYELSIESFKTAAEFIESGQHKVPEAQRQSDLEKLYRNIAYNSQLLEDEEEALKYAEKAKSRLETGEIEPVLPKSNWLKIGVLGWNIPVWNAKNIGIGQSTASEGFTTDEEYAVVYSIMGKSHANVQQFRKAIEYEKQKLQIYIKLENKHAEAIIRNNIGILHYIIGDFQGAWDYFESSLELSENYGYYDGAIANIVNLCALALNLTRSGFNQHIVSVDSSKKPPEQIPVNTLDAGIDFVNRGLRYYTLQDIVLNPRHKIQLYNLIANIHLIKARQHFKRVNPEISIQDIDPWLSGMDEYMLADSCYTMALRVASQIDDKRQAAVLHINRGLLYSHLQEWQPAMSELTAAMNLAKEINLVPLLWRVNHAVANTVYRMGAGNATLLKVANDPASYYYTAIELVEANVLAEQSVRIPTIRLQDVRPLYEDAIRYFSEIGDSEEAFYLSRCLHARLLLGNMAGKRLELKSEYHKNKWRLAQFLQEEINELEADIRYLEFTSSNKVSKELNQKRDALAKNKHEYLLELEEIKRDDPELESMVRVNPPPYQRIQPILPDSTLLISYLVTEDKLFIWILDRRSLEQRTVDISRNDLHQLTRGFYQAIDAARATAALPDTAIANLATILLVPIDEAIAGARHLIFVPDDCLQLLPFSLLINSKYDMAFDKLVSSVPSISDYYLCFLRRKISGGKIGIAGDNQLLSVISEAGFEAENLLQPTSSSSYSEFELKAEDCHFLHFTGEIRWNTYDANASRIVLRRIPAQVLTFNLMDIFAWLLKANVMIFDSSLPPESLIDNAYPFNYFQQIAFYAGTPTIVFTLWQVDDPIRHEFYSYFYEYLHETTPGNALRLAQAELFQQHPDSPDWAAFQLSGYIGMSFEEEEQFAEERFTSSVLKGHNAYNNREWQDAIDYYETALLMAQARGDNQSISRLYDRLFETSFKGRQFDKAIDYQQKLLKEAEANQDIQGMLLSYYNLMTCYTANKNYETSLKYQAQYAELTRKYDLKQQEAESYIKLGQIQENAGNYQSAIDAYEKAIQYYQTIGDQIMTAVALKNIGRIHLRNTNDFQSAIACQTRALALFKDEGDDNNTIATLHDIGLSYEKLANYRQAFHFQQDAYQLAVQVEDSLMIGLSTQYLANLSWKTGDYQLALSRLRDAMQIFEIYHHQLYLIVAYSTQGLIYMSLGRPNDALAAERKALELAEKMDNKLDQATIHKNLGLIHGAQKNWRLALQSFMKAREIDELLQNKQGLAYDYRNLGVANHQLNEYLAARSNLQKALQLSREIGDLRNEAQCSYELSRVYFARANPDSALSLATLAAQQAEFLMLPDLAWRANRVSAQVFRQMNQMDSSLVRLEKAAAIVEAMRSQLKVEEYKSGFIDDKLDVYYDIIRLLLEMNRPAQAFEAAERAKSRNFIDMLANRDIQFGSTSAGTFTSRKDSLTQLISDTQNEIAFLRSKSDEFSPTYQQQISAAEQKLGEFKQAYEALIVRMQEENPELADLVSVNPISAKDIQRSLQPGTALLEYIITQREIIILTASSEKFDAQIVPFQQDSLEAIVKKFRDNIAKRYYCDDEGKKLFSILIKPVQMHLEATQHLIIVPHGVLHYVPFAALKDNDNRYLLEFHSLSLAPSSTVLGYCLKKGQPYLSSQTWEKDVLALGNPNLGNPDMELTFAAQEIRSLQRTYPQVEAFLDEEATETNFKQSVAGKNIIVFSCHGEYDEKNPLFSALLLAADKQNNGRLEAHEIFGIDLKAYLVSMSACETGLGTIVGGDEVIGLSRSFIFAGASSLMASLWKVDDLATAVLIKRFFRYLNEGKSRSLALQQAQLLVRHEINSHPAFWAAFNVIGDFR